MALTNGGLLDDSSVALAGLTYGSGVRVRFAGRLSASRHLAPGAYRVQVVATDLSGNRSKPAMARFRLRR